jgi:hypothetical protein
MSNETQHSLIVVEMLEPYWREIATLLALPAGFSMRFRYRKKWFELDHSSLIGTRCLLSLRATKEARILPIRFAKVTHVRDIGDIIYIETCVADLVELDSGSQVQKEQLASFQKVLKDGPLKDCDNLADVGMEKLLFQTPSYEDRFGNQNYTGDDDNRQIAAWGVLVELLLKYEQFSNLDFLHILDIDPPISKKSKTSYVLKGDTSYCLTVLQRRGNVPPAREVHILLDQTNLQPILEKQAAVGAYDLLKLSFRTTNASYQSKSTSIILKETCDVELIPLFPPLVLPVRIESRSKLPFMISAFIFLLAAVTLFFPQIISNYIEIKDSSITNVAILVAIIASRYTVIGKDVVSRIP